MRRFVGTILILAIVGAAPGGPAAKKTAEKPRWGSVTRQLMLKYRLQKIAADKLAASLDHNRRRWQSLSPDQQERFRKDALAFEQKSLAEQKKLLKQYDKFAELPADKRAAYRRRAKWLKKVVASFADDERSKLIALPPGKQARDLLARKAKLIREGKLEDRGPATAPAPTTRPTAPATQPAS